MGIGFPTEDWLRSPDHNRFAEAATLCQHAGAFCIGDRFCHFDGTCFRSDRQAMRKAVTVIRRAANDEPADISRALLRAAELLVNDYRDEP